MPFEIVRNDITKMAVDAIVNTANPRPVIGAGTDYAVHKAAGPRLLRARQKIGDISPGSAAATRAFRLRAKFVLHTVSPAWQGGDCRELELLRQAYDAALDLAVRLKCRSVAFPLMAAGSYGFPQDQALTVAIQAFTDFLLTHELRVYLVIFDGRSFSLASSLFDDLRSYIDENYVETQLREEYPAHGRDREKSRRQKKGDIPTHTAPRPQSQDFTELPGHWLGSASAPQLAPMADTALAAEESLEDFLRQRESSFSEHLLELLQEKGLKDSQVYHRAQVSRQLFNKIINRKDYRPKKNTAIQLALALELDLEQTQKLLGKAGYALTRSSKEDLVVQYYISRRVYSIAEINVALFDCGLPILKTGASA